MADLGQAYVQIIPKAEGISNKISSLLGKGSANAGKEAGTSIAGGIKKALVAAGIGAAVVGALKGAISEGGKLQQSYGGLETIYGKAAEQAKAFAKQAQQAGVSANDYAEQAVSFGAALKQAYGGDTTKAVQAANTAILDMTDNAAKMGTPLESIQNAYQGFAKQNYTMLDNLKLGYGGTKSEMERLLADAEKLTGQKYDINNLGDVYDAIHAIQGELGLTGVAAQEASKTFTGSFEAMKAAGKNLLGALALGEDVGPMMSTFASSLSTFLFDNLIPMIGNVLKSLPEAIGTFISEGGPKLLEIGKNLIESIKTGIETHGPQIVEAIPSLLQSLGNAITTYGPVLLQKGGDLLKWIGNGIVTYGPQIVTSLGSALSSLLSYIESNLPQWAAKGGEMLKSLAKSFVEHIPDMLAALAKLGTWILEHLGKLALSLVKAGLELVKGIGEGIVEGIGSIIGPAIQGVGDAIKSAINAVKSWLAGVWNSIKSTCSSVWNGIKAVASAVWNGIKTAVMTPINALKGVLSSAWGAIKGAASSAWNAIKSAIMKPIEAAKTKIKSILDKIKSFFPLHVGKIFSGLKLPHISVSGGKAPFGIAGKGSLPKFSVSWAAKGGIVDGATLIGAGEKGTEAIVPLDPFWNKMDQIAERLNGGMNNTFYITVDGAENPEQFADRLIKQIQLRSRMA